MHELVSRPYLSEDFAACLSVFDSNVPMYFAPSERPEFTEFLKSIDVAKCVYVVLTLDEAVVACGGLSLNTDTGKASLSWGMVDRSSHRQGLGTKMTTERLKVARATMNINEVVLATSRHTLAFYERHGFKVSKITPDGFAPGLDRYDMTLRLG